VTLGLAPLAGPLAWPLRFARKAGTVLFDFEGLRAFKAKLRPDRWDPIFLSFPRRQGAALSVWDVLVAFAHGRLWRFGLQTLLRGPVIIVWLLALALVPWTAALASVNTPRWFPAPWIHHAWVGFDVVLAAGLWALARRYRERLARGLLVAVAFDAVVTTIEAALWNVARVRGPRDVAVVAIGVAAPWFALLILRRVRRRMRRRRRHHAPPVHANKALVESRKWRSGNRSASRTVQRPR